MFFIRILPSVQLIVAGTTVFILLPGEQAIGANGNLSFGGLAAGAIQCQAFDESAGQPDSCRGALPISPHIAFRPSEKDEYFIKLGFAAGNGLNRNSPYQLAPWAADLEDDVKDINGRGRNYLLTAWYRRTFKLGPRGNLNATLGIIDSTDYLDNNTFAQDEYTQFMNEALTGSPQVFNPSYDLGIALRWDLLPWSIRAVYMNVGKDSEESDAEWQAALTDRDFGDDYNYVGAEVGFAIQTEFGLGNYRISYSGTSKDFADATGNQAERRTGVAVSFDQELGNTLGAFFRIHSQLGKAATDYKNYYAGGVDIRGGAWGRVNDNIGIGLAYLSGGNKQIKSTQVAEAYYRFAVTKQFAFTADLQYMLDDRFSGKDPKGFIFGLRIDAYL